MKHCNSYIKSAAVAVLALAFSATAVHTATAVSYTSRDIPTHISALGIDTTINGLFYNDLPTLPYITLNDYLGSMGDTVITTVADGNYSFTTQTNPNNAMVVNPEEDTIYFANYTGFVRGDENQSQQIQTTTTYIKNAKTEVVGEIKPVTLELKKYNIDLREENGKIYFPLSTLSDLFSISAYFGASYSNDEISILILSDDALTSFGTSPIWNSTARDQKLIDYSYNELCLIMDYLYGKPEQGYLAKTISEKGFDKALKETNTETKNIYNLLHSSDILDYIRGLYLLDAYLYDGGHTFLTGIYGNAPENSVLFAGIKDIFQNQTSSVLGFSALDKSRKNVNTKETIKKTRTNSLAGTNVKTWEADNASYYESGDTGIFSFDSFVDAVVPDFKWALDHAVKSGMKNFVIDLSANGGGSIAVVHYIMSIIAKEYTGVDSMTMLNGNRVRSTYSIDKNLDGNFDAEDDTYAPKLNFAVLTSKLSFSSGNLLPVLAKDKGVAVLGEQSGGGTCTSSRGFYPDGLLYVVSGFDCFVNSAGEQIDLGVKPDYLLEKYNGFYDFKSLSEKIHEFYGDNKTKKPAEKAVIPLAPNSGAVALRRG